jgi:cell division protein FtsW
MTTSRGPMLILISVFILLAMSVLMVFSVTAVSGDEVFSMLKKHVLQIVAGLIAFAITLKIPTEKYKIISPFLVAASLIALVMVLLPGLGKTAGGAQRWFALGPIRIQPGEFAKLGVILYMSSYIDRQSGKMKTILSGALIPLGIVAVFGALLLRQPDFGSTTIILVVVFLQLLLVSNLKHLAGLGAVAASAMVTLIFISPYRFRRFQSFLDPLADASASGYQLVQSLIAVGSGGLTGLGIGAGKQKLFYLPAAHTDFIYAVICEELGLLGGGLVLFLFSLIAVIGYGTAVRFSKNYYKGTLIVGLVSLIVIPAIFNMAVVLGLLPTKGLVLPFVSYGGSAMVINLTILGILIRTMIEGDDSD